MQRLLRSSTRLIYNDPARRAAAFESLLTHSALWRQTIVQLRLLDAELCAYPLQRRT